MNIEQWPLDDIQPYEQNPRINDAAVETVKTSIREFGFRQPIVVDEAGVIIVEGISLVQIQHQLGHSNAATTSNYLHSINPKDRASPKPC